MKISRIALISIGLFWLVGCQSQQPPVGLTVTVTRVVSGQTLEVQTASGLSEKVRLKGIAAPDLGQQPWGIAAKQKLEALLLSKQGQQPGESTVILDTDKEAKDPFGRRLAYVWHNGVLLNEQLVAEGYVLAEVESSQDRYSQRLLRAQEYARILGYGIWDSQQPLRLTPREFRSQDPS